MMQLEAQKITSESAAKKLTYVIELMQTNDLQLLIQRFDNIRKMIKNTDLREKYRIARASFEENKRLFELAVNENEAQQAQKQL